jgi:hypothetical protein
MTRYRLLLILVAFIAAFLGVLLGKMFIAQQPPIENRFHILLHDELNLDPSQEARLAVLEKSFAASRSIYEREMREDNRQLARAVTIEKGYGPRVAEAIDRSHIAMGMLQKQTMQHVFAMRAILRKDQAARFDAVMVEALTAPER